MNNSRDEACVRARARACAGVCEGEMENESTI